MRSSPKRTAGNRLGPGGEHWSVWRPRDNEEAEFVRHCYNNVDAPFVHSDLEPHLPVFSLLTDGTALVSVAQDRLVRVWDCASGVLLRVVDTTGITDVETLASSSGVVAFSGGQSGEIVIWSIPVSR